MGLFDKVKKGMKSGAETEQWINENATPAPEAGQIGVSGMPVNPAVAGGPSSAPLSMSARMRRRT